MVLLEGFSDGRFEVGGFGDDDVRGGVGRFGLNLRGLLTSGI
jgi:hypothetical protein